jgi:IS4 transposase
VSWVGERINHLVWKPDAGKLHVRFDERDMETETRSITQTPATERAGQQVMIAPTSTAPDLDSTRRPLSTGFFMLSELYRCRWQVELAFKGSTGC